MFLHLFQWVLTQSHHLDFPVSWYFQRRGSRVRRCSTKSCCCRSEDQKASPQPPWPTTSQAHGSTLMVLIEAVAEGRWRWTGQPGEAMLHWERRTGTWTVSQTQKCNWFSLPGSVGEVGISENLPSSSRKCLTLLRKTIPSVDAPSIKTELGWVHMWPMTKDNSFLSHVFFPFCIKEWKLRGGRRGQVPPHTPCFLHARVVLRPMLHQGERMGFNGLWNWARVLISKGDKKVTKSAHHTVKKQEMGDLSEHS